MTDSSSTPLNAISNAKRRDKSLPLWSSASQRGVSSEHLYSTRKTGILVATYLHLPRYDPRRGLYEQFMGNNRGMEAAILVRIVLSVAYSSSADLV